MLAPLQKALRSTLDVTTICSYYIKGHWFMKFEWDVTKNDTNIKRHGIDFKDAKKIFEGYTLTIEDDRCSP